MPVPVRGSKKAEIERRRKAVAANLLAGLTYREIAEGLGVSLGTVAKDVKTLMGRWQTEQVKDTGEYVALELRRLDVALHSIWDKVREGDESAIDRMLRIMERRARYKGLDSAPVLDLQSKGERITSPVVCIEVVKDYGQRDGVGETGSGDGPADPGPAPRSNADLG